MSLQQPSHHVITTTQELDHIIHLNKQELQTIAVLGTPPNVGFDSMLRLQYLDPLLLKKNVEQAFP
jgi:hypothetical protein